MHVSRSEMHQQDKLKRKKRLRKLLIVNFTLFGAIIVILGAWLITANSDKLAELFSKDKKEQAEAAKPDSAGSENAAEPADETNSAEDDAAVVGKEGGNDGSKDSSNASSNTSSNDSSTNVSPEKDDAAVVTEPAGSVEEKVSLSFVGDLLVADYVKAITDREGYDFLYKPSLLYLSEPDLTAGNLEFPVTTRGIPVEGTPYVFKGAPDVLPSMRDAGFDVMSLANNHALDQGVEGMLDTMKHLDEAGIAHMGAGNNAAEAYAPVIKEVRGIKVAYVGISRVVPFGSWKADKNTPGLAESYDVKRATAAIAKAKEQADIVVVMVHWGKERVDQPEPYQKDFGRQYIDAGADLVIGSHPHVLQGFEMYKGKWIAYSLGNFIFNSYPKETAGETGVLDALCSKNGDCEMTFHPMFTVNAQPTPLEADAGKALLDRLSAISFGVKFKEDGSIVPK
jgi:poly-gamma-glutamate capsule biosynthesis protein CapA/YwtB (metallophosphatase superfamily)